MATQDGSALSAASRIGMAATVIQSTKASRPRRAAKSWLTMVEKLLLIRPSSAAAIQFDFGPGMSAPLDLRILRSICSKRLDFGRLVSFLSARTLLRIAFVVEFLIAQYFSD